MEAPCGSSSDSAYSLWHLDSNVTVMWMRSNEASLDLWTMNHRLAIRVPGSHRGGGGIWELHTEIKYPKKVDTNRQPRATCVADKSNQSCPLHHLTSNKITSINNLSYEWLDFVCFQSAGGGCSIFPMIKAGPNCFDNIKDLAVAGCVRAVLGADRLVVAGDSDSEETTLAKQIHHLQEPNTA